MVSYVLKSIYTEQVPDSKVHGRTWGPPGSCRLQMGPMLASWTLLSGLLYTIPYSRITRCGPAARLYQKYCFNYRLIVLGIYLNLLTCTLETYLLFRYSWVCLSSQADYIMWSRHYNIITPTQMKYLLRISWLLLVVTLWLFTFTFIMSKVFVCYNITQRCFVLKQDGT